MSESLDDFEHRGSNIGSMCKDYINVFGLETGKGGFEAFDNVFSREATSVWFLTVLLDFDMEPKFREATIPFVQCQRRSL